MRLFTRLPFASILQISFFRRVVCRPAVTLLIVCGLAASAHSQELEPRRWSHLPIGANFGGGGYAHTSADITFDPVLLLNDVKMEMETFPLKYLRSFELLGKSARFDVWQSYQHARWKGTLDGVPASTSRSGWSDMSLRLAVNVIGAPPLAGEAFAQYRAANPVETIVGLALVVQIPTGHYINDKLLNLGSNRYTFRPQLGVVHNRNKWSFESTFSTWVFTDNDDFFSGNDLEQAPFYTLEGYFNYTFRPGLWAGTGLGYGIGSTTTLNGIDKNDERENLGWVASLGYPLSKRVGIKLAYIGIRTQVPVGADSDSLAAAMSILW